MRSPGCSEDPARAAVLLDVDGTLAPIVARPETAAVPDETRAELRAPRRALRARGVHQRADRRGGQRASSGSTGWSTRACTGWSWRRKRTPGAARCESSPALRVAVGRGQGPHRGVPLARGRRRGCCAGLARGGGRTGAGSRARGPMGAKGARGTAAASTRTRARQCALLLAEHGLRRALYAGDDTTDLDAFAGLDGLEVAVRVAVASAEAPPTLRERADLTVDSPAELLELLRGL